VAGVLKEDRGCARDRVGGVLSNAASRVLDWRDKDQDWGDNTSPMIPVVPTASRAR
jgi:hypothetical protein